MQTQPNPLCQPSFMPKPVCLPSTPTSTPIHPQRRSGLCCLLITRSTNMIPHPWVRLFVPQPVSSPLLLLPSQTPTFFQPALVFEKVHLINISRILIGCISLSAKKGLLILPLLRLPASAAASASATASLATTPPMGNAESNVHFSSLSPPLPNAFIQPFPFTWNSGFHVVTAGSKVGITAHWFVSSSLQDFFILLTTQLTRQLLE